MGAALFLFPTGLIFGSFATVVAYRVPRGEVVRHRALALPELRGADRRLRQRSGPLLAGAARALPQLRRAHLGPLPADRARAGACSSSRPRSSSAPATSASSCSGLVFVRDARRRHVTDLEQRIIPNKILAGRRGRGARHRRGRRPVAASRSALIAAVAAGGVLFLIALAYPRGMGMGDVKLVGRDGALSSARAVAPGDADRLRAGAIVGVVMIARDGAAARKRAVPFGPFLALGGVVGLWAGRDRRLVRDERSSAADQASRARPQGSRLALRGPI